MIVCELCGEEVPKGSDKCSRCGFDFPSEVTSDTRDQAILSKNDGREASDIKKGLAERFSKYISFFENMDPNSIRPGEFSSFVEEAVSHLHIPATIELDDDIKFNDKEKQVILVISRRLLDPDALELVSRVRTRTMIMLANGLYSLEMPAESMQMVNMAVHRDPKDMDALYGKAKILLFEKKYAASKRCLEKIINRQPDRDEAKYLLEMIEQISG